jgi:hypothetical protein
VSSECEIIEESIIFDFGVCVDFDFDFDVCADETGTSVGSARL